MICNKLSFVARYPSFFTYHLPLTIFHFPIHFTFAKTFDILSLRRFLTMNPHETNSFPREKTSADIAAGKNVCPVCSREAQEEFVSLKSLDKSLGKLIGANAPDTGDFQAVCVRCVELFKRAQHDIVKDAAMQKDGSHVLSTPLRIDAAQKYTGKGVTIAFLDSGFYPHPDLIEPKNRIIGYRHMLMKEGDTSQLFDPDVASWHGMMTSVVAAGNGSLSNGFYRGAAPDAKVVLVKLAKTGRITEQNIQDGLAPSLPLI